MGTEQRKWAKFSVCPIRSMFLVSIQWAAMSMSLNNLTESWIHLKHVAILNRDQITEHSKNVQTKI